MKAPINQKSFIFKLIFTNMVVYIYIFRFTNFFKDMITENNQIYLLLLFINFDNFKC